MSALENNDKTRQRLAWDVPTRVMHWLLVVFVGMCWWSGINNQFKIISIAVMLAPATINVSAGDTRYDRCAHTFFSAICIAAIVIFWINQ